MSSASGKVWKVTLDNDEIIAFLFEVIRFRFIQNSGNGQSYWGSIEIWDSTIKDYRAIWHFERSPVMFLGSRPVLYPESSGVVKSFERGVYLEWKLSNAEYKWANDLRLRLKLYHGCSYVEFVVEFESGVNNVVNLLPEFVLKASKIFSPATQSLRDINSELKVVDPKYEIGLQRFFLFVPKLNTDRKKGLIVDARFLESMDFTANVYATLDDGEIRLHFGGYTVGLRCSEAYGYLRIRSLNGHWKLVDGGSYSMRWFVHFGSGSEKELAMSGIPAEPWGTYIVESDIPKNLFLSWSEVIGNFPLTISQLEQFPHARGLNGSDAGIAPYKKGLFSDFTQWFYLPQIYWPFALEALIQGQKLKARGLLNQIIKRLWAYSRSKKRFKPVNSINITDCKVGLQASTFHWGSGIVALSQIWQATKDARVLTLLRDLYDICLEDLPEDNVPRFIELESFTYNDQPRYGTNGLWAIGLITLYNATGEDNYIRRAVDLLRGANSKLNNWELMGGIENWDGLKPDGIAYTALANFLLYEVSRKTQALKASEIEWLEAGRIWAMIALSLIQVGEVNSVFANSFDRFGSGVSNVGWTRAGQYPDSDGRCEASLETITTTNTLLYSTKYFKGETLRSFMELAAVIRKTHLSYCMKGCNGQNSEISMLAHELHDNNTDILEPDRWPLVTSYMTGAPNLEALIFSVIQCDNPDIVCINRSIYFGDLRELDLILFNPLPIAVETEIKFPYLDYSSAVGASQIKVNLGPKDLKTLKFSGKGINKFEPRCVKY